ncbi:MAG: SurA N-terminal domain-containing protein [bacterium]|nr:SurA N-terminal domain-containing protein [bacterium]
MPAKIKTKTANKLSRRQVVVALIIIAAVGFTYYFRGLFVSATVNGQPISRLSIIKELEKRQGKAALDSLITETLILQETAKQKVAVPQADIDAELASFEGKLKESGQDLNAFLASSGWTKEDLVKQIKIQKLVEKVLGDKIAVTEDEINKYINDNKDLFAEGIKDEEKKTQAKEALRQQKLGEEFQKWLADLQAKAKIDYFVGY